MLSTSILVDTAEADNSDFNRNSINIYIKTAVESPNRTIKLDNFILATSLYLLDPYPLTPVDESGLFLLRENLPALFPPPVEVGQPMIFSDFLISSMEAIITRFLGVNATAKYIEINLKKTYLTKFIVLGVLSNWHKVAFILYAQNKKMVANKLFFFAYKNLTELIDDYVQQPCFPPIAESYAYSIYEFVMTPPITGFEHSMTLINQAASILAEIPLPYSAGYVNLYCKLQAAKTQLLMFEAIRLVNFSDFHLKSLAFNYYEQSLANNNGNLLIVSNEAICSQNEFITKMIIFTEAAVNIDRKHNIYLYKNILQEYSKLPPHALSPAQLSSTAHYHKVLARAYREEGDDLGFQPHLIAEAQENYRLAMTLLGLTPDQYKSNEDRYEQEYCNRNYALFSVATLLDPAKNYTTEEARLLIDLSLRNNDTHIELMNDAAQQIYFQHQHKFTQLLVQYAEFVSTISDDKQTAAACYEAAVHELKKIPINRRFNKENEIIREWEIKFNSYLQVLATPATSIYSTPLTTFGIMRASSERKQNENVEAANTAQPQFTNSIRL